MFFCNVIFMLIITSCVIANTSGQLSHSSNDSCLISKPDLLANSSHESSVPTRLLFLGSLMNLRSSNRILTTSLFPLCRDLSPKILQVLAVCRFTYQAQNLPVILDAVLGLPSISFPYPVSVSKYFSILKLFSTPRKSLTWKKGNHFQ